MTLRAIACTAAAVLGMELVNPVALAAFPTGYDTLVGPVCRWAANSTKRPRLVLAGGDRADQRTSLDAMIAEDVSLALEAAGCLDLVERSQLEHLWSARATETGSGFDADAVRSFSNTIGAQALLAWTRSETGSSPRITWKLLDVNSGNIVAAGAAPIPAALIESIGASGSKKANAVLLDLTWPRERRVITPWGTWRNEIAPFPTGQSLSLWPVWVSLPRPSTVFLNATRYENIPATGALVTADGRLVQFQFFDGNDHLDRSWSLVLGTQAQACGKFGMSVSGDRYYRIAGVLTLRADRVDLRMTVVPTGGVGDRAKSFSCRMSVPVPTGEQFVGLLLEGEAYPYNNEGNGTGFSTVKIVEGIVGD